ncbi:uncharacterized protein [Diabrotica undecimpunctata]|uniref:uncharacterized protein n=1 Tax=Diabrotica undecimpunctata TaxID=50387 RepID=UPI003B63901C
MDISLDPKSFYGSSIRRHRFLIHALDDVEASTSAEPVDIVILPPDSADQGTESDEDTIDDQVLDIPDIPDEVPGEVEIHAYESSDEDKEENVSVQRKWKKSEKVGIQAQASTPPRVGDEHLGKSEFEIFSIYSS